jgi:hypothetical protein
MNCKELEAQLFFGKQGSILEKYDAMFIYKRGKVLRVNIRWHYTAVINLGLLHYCNLYNT